MSGTPVAPPFSRDVLARTWLAVKAFSDAGDAAWTVALAWVAVQVASPAVAGLVVAAGTVPRALVLLVGGVAADRLDARRVMVASTGARLVVLGAVLVVDVGGQITLPALLVASVAFGVCDAVYEPSAATIGRQLVRREDLSAYAGLGQALSRLGTLAGAALGGLLVARGGLAGAALFDAVTFVAVGAVLVGWLRPRHRLARAEAEPVLRSVAAGFAHLRTAPHTRSLVLTLSGLNLFVGPALSIGLAVRAQADGWGAAALGTATSLVGAGGVLGSLVMTRWRPGRPAVVAFTCLVVQGAAIVALGAGGRTVSAAACLVIGVSAGMASTLLGALFVATADEAYLGRLSAVLRLGDDVLMPAAMAAFGALVSVGGATMACTVFGGTMAALMFASLVRSSRWAPPEAPGPGVTSTASAARESLTR
ncbi:MFS transporter [Cellulomonas soli]|uniref:MFS transporter n=1 Tax=Cellulomonas soli TaxID=931535 RepID=UPI003F853B51